MRRHADQGAALILVVLMTLLLLAGLLVTTMKLGLSSRQTTSDQARTLAAQYAAESSLAAARSRLRDIQTLMAAQSIDLAKTLNLSTNTMQDWAQKWCQVGPSGWTPTSEFTSADPDKPNYPFAEQCVFTPAPSGTLPASQFDVLAELISDSAYSILPVAERPSGPANANARKVWWKQTLMDPFTQTSDGGRKRSDYQLRPLRAVALTSKIYRFYVGVVSMETGGKKNNSERVLRGRNTVLTSWYFQLDASLDDLFFTNHHRMKSNSWQFNAPPDVNFVNQTFDGSIHTNEKFLFINGATAQFKGQVTSAGCRNLPLEGLPPSGNCDPIPGVRIGNTTHTINNLPANPSTSDRAAANASLQQIIDTATDVSFAPASEALPTPVDFTAAYRALPQNASDQQAAAQSGGLVLNNGAVGVNLFAGNAAGQPLTSYNTTTKRWAEPSPTYQYIQVYIVNSAGQTVVDPQRRYRVDKDGALQKFNPSSNSWVNNGSFNGVIYGQSLNNVTGPARIGAQNGNNLANVPPALASFSKVTLVAQGDVRIHTDLTMSDTPCTNAEYREETCQKLGYNTPRNVLGIYSQSGDVVLSTSTPSNLNIHAALAASSGEIKAQNHDSRPVQGNVNLIGSMLQNWYGAFGTVNGLQSKSGYGRNFSFDRRLGEGHTPPAWFSAANWAPSDAVTNLDSVRLDDLLWAQVAKP